MKQTLFYILAISILINSISAFHTHSRARALVRSHFKNRNFLKVIPPVSNPVLEVEKKKILPTLTSVISNVSPSPE